MKKILPINLEPCIHTYTHHGFFHAVTCTDDKVNRDIEKEVASIQVNTINQIEWKTQIDQMKYRILPNNIINFYGNKWNTYMNAAFWRECKFIDELEVVIYQQLYSNAFANIIIFLASNHDNSMTDIDTSYEFQFGNYSKDGLFYRIKNNAHINVFSPSDKPIKISLRREGNIISVKSNEESDEILQLTIPSDISIDRIGFAVNLGCNSYYEWLFSNYINLFVNITSPMPIDYLCNVHKDWHTNTSNYFLDYRAESCESIKSLGLTVIDFIIKMIDLKRYIEVRINDNIHLGLAKERKPFFHQNLIYGYDDIKEELYVLYINRGKIKPITMKYSEFISKDNYLKDRIFYMYEYNSGYELYKLSPNHILQVFQEYKTSKNISFYEPYSENYCFGLKSLDILSSEKGIVYLLNDIRISHLLYERSMCNKNRVEYFLYKKIINLAAYNEIYAVINEQCKVALKLRNSILKNMMSGRPSKTIIKEYLNQFIDLEYAYVEYIITNLSI